ncbi:DNA polymerase III subunit gamma/tau [Candidatus Wolfebacteria bacterium]|nr:DNA polymerase III subunit gamma/tau [Candidatus Wolfebacteria bacterium]
MIAIYRKYRPKNLSEMLGQEAVSEIIKNAARLDRLSHAYLFYGPKGSGKTTTARILAKIANCEKRQQDEKFKKLGEPCNQCRSCLEIDKGLAMDVIEIDAASNRGIDEIRNLKESIRVSPSSSFYKIYIIDETHQLTKDAFNALLKTLEEPPAHAIIILVTTEIEKMPATIVSRTQRFHFKRLPLKIIIEKLKSIAKEEKIKISDKAIELIASSAGGSFRDAESLLDQMASFKIDEKSKTKTIDIENVEKILGQVAFIRTSELAEFLIKNNLSAALEFLSSINENGYNLVQFCYDLIHYFRKVLSLKFSPDLEKHFSREMTDQELNIIKKHSKLIDSSKETEKIIKLIKSLIQAYTEMRYSPFTLVPLEVAIIESLK